MLTRRSFQSGTTSFFVVIGILLPVLAYPSTNDRVVLITIVANPNDIEEELQSLFCALA